MADSVLLLALYPLGLTVGGDERKQLWYCLLTYYWHDETRCVASGCRYFQLPGHNLTYLTLSTTGWNFITLSTSGGTCIAAPLSASDPLCRFIPIITADQSCSWEALSRHDATHAIRCKAGCTTVGLAC